jgi:flagellar protein FlaJ
MFESLATTLREKNGGSIPFEEHMRSLKQYLVQISDNKKMGGDILFMITYMASITTAHVTRPEIFAYTAMRQEYVTSHYIERVEFFVKRWNYSYSEALRMMAERVKNPMLRSLLNRYANSTDSGVPDEDFLLLELSTVRSVYRNTFEQGIEMLKKWGDAYIAMMLSATIVGIIIMVSVAIYAPDEIDSTLNASYMILLMIAAMGVTTMYRAIPGDSKTHGMPGGGSHEQGMIRRMERVILPITAVTTLLLVLAGINFGLIILLIALLVAPMGIIAMKDDMNIVARDEDFSVFIRGLGSIMGGKGLTTVYALGEVDRKSLEVLGPFIDSVYSKLNLGLDDAAVWERFLRESGSNLICKFLNIFRDSVALGGAPAEIGKIVSSSMLEMVLLRQKREMLSTGFIVLLIPMHMAMVAIFMFLFQILISMAHAITSVMESFAETSAAMSSSTGTVGSGMMASVGIFTNFPEAKMSTYVVTVLMMITISNVLAGKIVKGGDRSMYYFFTSVLFGLTGIIYIVTPFIVDLFFQIPVMGAV